MHSRHLRCMLLVVCLVGLFGFTPAPGMAQTPSATCSSIVKQVVQDLSTTCQGLLPGNTCYGHKTVEATFADDNQNPPFANPGDQASVSKLKRIHSLPLDLALDQLGAAALNFGDRASDPTATPVATALMFGDVTLNFAENTAAQNSRSAQSLYFRTAFGETVCDEAQSQFMIRSTTEKPVTLSINGADLTINSLVSFRGESPNSIRVTVYQGSLEIADGPTAQAGQTLIAVVDNEGTVVMWSAPRPATRQESTALEVFSQLSGQLAVFVSGCAPNNTHVVAPGENLFRIALRYKTSVNTIMAVNNLTNASLIHVGQRLRVPCGNTSAPVTNGTSTPRPVVANPTVVPASAACNTVITVASNDNLYRMALRYHTTVPAIMAANNLTNPNLIQVGQRLTIPCTDMSAPVTNGVNIPQPAASNPTATPASAACNTIITVMPSDNLSEIAQRYQTTIAAILAANNLTDSQMPFPGQSLIIPCN